MLATPGALDKLLNIVRSEHVDEIVQRKIDAAKAEDARAAALASPQAGWGSGSEFKAPKFNDDQLLVMKKLGVEPAEAAKAIEGTWEQGPWIRGNV